MSKKIQVRLKNEVIWDDFKQMVKNKYGIYHTNMALELQTAIIKHLSDEGFPGYEDIRSMISQSIDASDETITHTQKLGKHDQILIDYLYTHLEDNENISFEALCKIMVSECNLTSISTHKRHITLFLSKNILREPLDVKSYSFYFIIKSELKPYVSPDIIVKEEV